MGQIKSAQGFTLLEVLVALVVFSVGLLGLAGLQIASLKLSHDSLLRTSATLLAKDMADRIRANRDQAKLSINSPYNNPLGLKTGYPSCLSKNSGGEDIQTSCSPAQRAAHDFYEWDAKLQGAFATDWHPAIQSDLPFGDGVVCIDSTPDDGLPPPNDPGCDNIPSATNPVFVIKIWWSERKDISNQPEDLHRFVMSVAL